ncbi:hypothetical protein DAPK24_016120 [Pichia kluyveri]|uniref:CUE domain-containing protein n=1 Tax=Pichia kluyveri TaxID=36015 RepID=A0AAV5R214_PICKL|nr:hypothetical protein DAPK24_016120 [Pichia kluyveri]
MSDTELPNRTTIQADPITAAESTTVPTEPAIPDTTPDTPQLPLQDVFPDIDVKYIKMALIASDGDLQNATNALLFLSDPTSDIPIPSPKVIQEPPVSTSISSSTPVERRRSSTHHIPHSTTRVRSSNSSQKPVNTYLDREDSDDDLYNVLTKNVNEAKQTVSSWFNNVSKSFDTTINNNNNNTNYNNNYTSYKPNRQPFQSLRSNAPHTDYSDNSDYNPPLPSRPNENTPKLPRRPLYSAVNHSNGSLINDSNDDKEIESKLKLTTISNKNTKPITMTELEPEPESISTSKSKSESKTESKSNDKPELEREPSTPEFLVEDSDEDINPNEITK